MLHAVTFALILVSGLGDPARELPSGPQGLATELTVSDVLGIEMGMPIERARELLTVHGRRESRPTRDGGTKEVWRLERTGFDWIAMKAGADGRLVWLTGHRRPGYEVAFDSVEGVPRLATDSIAIWHATGRYAPQRLTLRGRHRRAEVVTLAEVPDGS